MSTCQDFKTTFKHNLTCIFLSLKAKLKKKHFALGHPVEVQRLKKIVWIAGPTKIGLKFRKQSDSIEVIRKPQ